MDESKEAARLKIHGNGNFSDEMPFAGFLMRNLNYEVQFDSEKINNPERNIFTRSPDGRIVSERLTSGNISLRCHPNDLFQVRFASKNGLTETLKKVLMT